MLSFPFYEQYIAEIFFIRLLENLSLYLVLDACVCVLAVNLA